LDDVKQTVFAPASLIHFLRKAGVTDPVDWPPSARSGALTAAIPAAIVNILGGAGQFVPHRHSDQIDDFPARLHHFLAAIGDLLERSSLIVATSPLEPTIRRRPLPAKSAC
jgi:hypothetical protein